jgi:peptidoglycan biosynthesis protein MviN/MurJ (putative lipid II flippase)
VLSLAIAFSLASLVQMFLLLFILRSKFESLDDYKILGSLMKVAAASFAGGIFIQLFKFLMAKIVDMDTFIGVFFQFSVSALIGILIFILVCHWLRLEEFIHFKDSLIRRIFRKNNIIPEESPSDISGV